MLNKTPTREEKIEQNEPHQKCFDPGIRKQTQLTKIKYQNPPKRMEDEPNIILRENTIGHDMSNTNPAKNRSELRSSGNVSSSCITKYGGKS